MAKKRKRRKSKWTSEQVARFKNTAKKKSRKKFVYALYMDEPVNENVRYIGQTCDPGDRFSQHISQKLGQTSELVMRWSTRYENRIGMIIFPVDLTTPLDVLEITKIEQYRNMKIPVFNLHDGGKFCNKVRVDELYLRLLKRWEECDPAPDKEDVDFVVQKVSSMASRMNK